MSKYSSTMREMEKRRKRKEKGKQQHNDWRKKYRELGPVEFAHNELACPPDVPEHPTFGKPEYVILSPEQIDFLNDLWKGQKLSIVAAARGAGKTFALAVYVCWRVACFDDYEVTCMGGSSQQSEYIQGYIDYWRVKNDILFDVINKSIGGHVAPRILSRWRAIARFSPCSPTASRGPHVRLVVIDEVCAAEEKGVDGQKAVKAAWWQIIGKKDTQLIMTSTAHHIFGTFYDYYSGPQGKDFKKYRWSIAKHVSGIKNPYKTYTDINPDNWVPNVWWVTDEDVKALRKAKSNDEWLCEALGGISMMGGMVFKREDLDIAICSKCEECIPYHPQKCSLITDYKLGEGLKNVTERVAGIDWGRRSPNAIVIIGRKGERIFVLFAEEMMSAVTEESLHWAKTHLNKWKCDTVYPDPSEKSMAMALEQLGEYAIILIWETLGKQAKLELMINVKRYFEKKLIVIPKAFEELIHSLRQMSLDDRGKIIKRHDHSYDALTYALREFDLQENLSDFWKVKGRAIKDIW